MPSYTVSHSTPAGTTLPIINLTGSATMQVKLSSLIVGFVSTPGDIANDLRLMRTTDVGTGGSALTEEKMDPLTPVAAAAAVGGTFGGAPAQTGASLLAIPLHQRNTFFWVATTDQRAIKSAASANAGIVLESVASGGTPTCRATMGWEE